VHEGVLRKILGSLRDFFRKCRDIVLTSAATNSMFTITVLLDTRARAYAMEDIIFERDAFTMQEIVKDVMWMHWKS